jgi:hypothetical protein
MQNKSVSTVLKTFLVLLLSLDAVAHAHGAFAFKIISVPAQSQSQCPAEIEDYNTLGNSYEGSAFLLPQLIHDQQFLVTANHIFPTSAHYCAYITRAAPHSLGATAHSATLVKDIKQDYLHDLAVMALPDSLRNEISTIPNAIGERELAVNDVLTLHGYPAGAATESVYDSTLNHIFYDDTYYGSDRIFALTSSTTSNTSSRSEFGMSGGVVVDSHQNPVAMILSHEWNPKGDMITYVNPISSVLKKAQNLIDESSAQNRLFDIGLGRVKWTIGSFEFVAPMSLADHTDKPGIGGGRGVGIGGGRGVGIGGGRGVGIGGLNDQESWSSAQIRKIQAQNSDQQQLTSLSQSIQDKMPAKANLAQYQTISLQGCDNLADDLRSLVTSLLEGDCMVALTPTLPPSMTAQHLAQLNRRFTQDLQRSKKRLAESLPNLSPDQWRLLLSSHVALLAAVDVYVLLPENARRSMLAALTGQWKDTNTSSRSTILQSLQANGLLQYEPTIAVISDLKGVAPEQVRAAMATTAFKDRNNLKSFLFPTFSVGSSDAEDPSRLLSSALQKQIELNREDLKTNAAAQLEFHGATLLGQLASSLLIDAYVQRSQP